MYHFVQSTSSVLRAPLNQYSICPSVPEGKQTTYSIMGIYKKCESSNRHVHLYDVFLSNAMVPSTLLYQLRQWSSSLVFCHPTLTHQSMSKFLSNVSNPNTPSPAKGKTYASKLALRPNLRSIKSQDPRNKRQQRSLQPLAPTQTKPNNQE
jgi:hypothetical protein